MTNERATQATMTDGSTLKAAHDVLSGASRGGRLRRLLPFLGPTRHDFSPEAILTSTTVPTHTHTEALDAV